jgi:Zn-dependent peptidase ImmA (M78 family)
MKSIKKLLREGVENINENRLYGQKPHIDEFVKFANQYLGNDKPCKVVIRTTRDGIQTTAFYNVVDHEIHVYALGRALVDILRSIAHELTHHRQNIRGELNNVEEDGSDGSNIENEANAMAGEIIRKYGKQNPDIYIK